jgi:predicted unusual protein kinase regulating ubiquinone biosynthesis (AarF/ABC1/UbiB family)
MTPSDPSHDPRLTPFWQGLVERFAPQQRTNYVALLNEWAVGFYTELDFLNEAQNQQKIKDMLIREVQAHFQDST